MFDIGILDEVDGRLQEERNHLFSVQEDVFHQEMADERIWENPIYNTVTASRIEYDAKSTYWQQRKHIFEDTSTLDKPPPLQ